MTSKDEYRVVQVSEGEALAERKRYRKLVADMFEACSGASPLWLYAADLREPADCLVLRSTIEQALERIEAALYTRASTDAEPEARYEAILFVGCLREQATFALDLEGCIRPEATAVLEGVVARLERAQADTKGVL